MAKRIEIDPDWEPWRKEIAEALNDSGMSMKEVSLKAGMAETYVRDTLKRSRAPAFDRLKALQKVLNIIPNSADPSDPLPLHSIRVEGVSHAGRFEDISLIADDEFSREVLAAPRDDRFPHAHQYALRVSGDSMNLRYPDGGYVICAAWNDTGLELRDGHAVHVERIRFASERETTIKIYKEIDDKRWLYPDSTNKNHQPIEINGDTDIEIIIKGIILATYSKQVI